MTAIDALNQVPIISLDEQIRCVIREIAMRESAYPRWIKDHRLTQAKADHEIAAMTAVLRTLQSLRDNPT